MPHVIEREQIPKVQPDIAGRALLAAVERYYSNPANVKRYCDWFGSPKKALAFVEESKHA